MKKKNFIILFIILLIIILAWRMYPKSGSFDKLILAKYTHTQFVDITMNKNGIMRSCDNINKIDDFLSHLKKLQLTEYRRKIPTGSGNTYFISIYNTGSSYIGIIIEDKNFIEIDMKTNNGTMISKNYRINDNSLDMKYIENFYNNGKAIKP